MEFRRLLILLSLVSELATHAQDFDRAPEPDIAPTIFYLNGRIIEDKGIKPIHDRWGVYDYPAIVESQGSRGAHVVSEARESGTNIYEYAGKTIKDIESAIANGVPPNQIVVVGFSKGGAIAIHVSSFLRRPEIRYVFLAACGDWISSYPHLRLSGDILSVVEQSDDLAVTCGGLRRTSEQVGTFREITISTGKEHGAFYIPRQEWLDLVLNWIHNNDA